MKVVYSSVLAKVNAAIDEAIKDKMLIDRIELTRQEWNVFFRECIALDRNYDSVEAWRTSFITYRDCDIVQVAS